MDNFLDDSEKLATLFPACITETYHSPRFLLLYNFVEYVSLRIMEETANQLLICFMLHLG